MDDPLLVGGVERVGNLPRDGQRVAHGQRPFREAIGERHAVDELEHQRGHAIHVLETVDRADVGVIERRQYARFALEACEPLRVGGEDAREDLDRNVASQLRVARAIDFTHTASAELGHHGVGPHALPRIQTPLRGHRWHLQGTRRAVMCAKQGLDLCLQIAPTRAALRQERRPFGGLPRECLAKKILEIRP